MPLTSAGAVSTRRRAAPPRARAPGAATRSRRGSRRASPGRLTTSVRPTTPAVPRESSPCGVFATSRRAAPRRSPAPRAASTVRVASGVTSRGARPVPPVVSTSARVRGELLDRGGDLGGLVGNDPPLDVVAVGAQALARAGRRSCRRPRRARRGRRPSARRRSSLHLLDELDRSVICLSTAFAMS